MLRALRLSSVVMLLLLVVGCGGAPKHSASNTRSAATASTTQSSDGSSNQLAGVVSACERSGGSALLPGSGGQDSSSLPDDTTAVCGCWTQWMASNLSSTDQTAIAASVDESGSLTGATLTDIPLLGELGTALSSCDLGQTPAPNDAGSPTSGANAPSSTGQTSTAPNGQGTGANGSGESGSGAGALDKAPTFGPPCGTVTGGHDDYQGLKLTVYAGTGVPCATAKTVIADLSAGNAQNHPGPSSEQSYFSVAGWRCVYGNMDSQPCSKGRLYIEADGPGVKP